MKSTYDVVVIGGGTAGTIAAIQSGRGGANTLLVEKNSMLGGTMTVAGIHRPEMFFAWGRQIISGIGWELVCKTRAERGEPSPAADQPSPRFDKLVFTALADDAALAAGVDLLFHSMLASVEFVDGAWTIQICTKTGLHSIRAKVLIDATGDANAVGLAGFELVHSKDLQSASLTFGCSGFDSNTLDYDALRVAADSALTDGSLVSTDISWRNEGPRFLLQRHGYNANHLRAPYAESSEGKSMAEVEGRKSLLRVFRFLRKQPGLGNFQIDWVAPEVGIRETVVIRGKKTVTTADYECGKSYEDAVCYAFYPIDQHLRDGKGVKVRALKQGVLPTIPRGALLPMGSRFLLAAGRCLASEQEANSALRVQCSCMAMGQAAGAMAVLSARTGIDLEDLPMADIYSLLREHGAILPGDVSMNSGQPEPPHLLPGDLCSTNL